MNLTNPQAKHPRTVQEPEEIPFEKLIDININKPGRYMGLELGVKPHQWEIAKVRWALTYPELYEVGASNLGHIILYSILNAIPGQLCDRAYLPAEDLAKRLRDLAHPLFAVESRRPLSAFDILGFSLSYELGGTNILEMLDLSGLPIYAADREDIPIVAPNATPLIFAGGPTATSNPEPFAAFFDFFALGDGEELLPEIGLVISEAKKARLTRSSTLRDLAEIPGIYVPSLYSQGSNGISIIPLDPNVKRKVIRRVSKPIPHYSMGLVPNIETVHDRLTIEIRRGCTKGCRFCQPGMLTRPARDVEPDDVIEAVQKGMKATGYSDFSLLSLSCSDYLSLPSVGIELRNKLADQNITLQLPSQRVDLFNDDIAHILGGARSSGLTFAPEAGTQRLRNIINKGLTNSDLIKGIRKAMENNYRKIKLYFMIGLPGETDEDVLGIANTCQILQRECSDLGRLSLNITISNFTPKPHTPFQWHSVSTKELKRRQELLKNTFKNLKGIRTKVNFTDVRISAIENFIGRGDRRVAKVIEAAWEAGAGMDAWYESIDKTHQAWESAISAAGLKGQYRNIELGSWDTVESINQEDLQYFCSQPLPWDHIDTGIDKTWLAQDLQNALKEIVVPDCSFNNCSKCGVCGPELGHNIVIKPPPIPEKIKSILPNSKKVCRLRFQFSKTGSMIWISHLDLVRVLERAIRRSGLPISFSGGYHPMPRIQIALALPLGVEAFGEWLDLEFTEEINIETVYKKLQENLPNGIKILNGYPIKLSSPSLSQELTKAKWGFTISKSLTPPLTSSQWENTANKIINSPTLLWNDKDKKGRSRNRDFKPLLHSLKLHFEKNNLERIFYSNTVSIELETNINALGMSIKPIQIKHWMEKELNQTLHIENIKRHELQLLQC